MATTGIKAMEITATMATIIKDMEDIVAMIILVTTIIMDMVTTMVSKKKRKKKGFTFMSALPFIFCYNFISLVDESGGYGKSPRRGGHTNSYKPY